MSFITDWLTIYKPAIDAAVRAQEGEDQIDELPLVVTIAIWLVLASLTGVVTWCVWDEYRQWHRTEEALQRMERRW